MPIDLAQLMRAKQDILATTLGLTAGVGHPVAKGDIGEDGWRKALAQFLPARYRVSRGAFIVDSNGAESLEIDLVIHDNYFHPEFFEAGQRSLIPRESVYAVFEVKPELTSGYIEYAIQRAESVRALKSTSVGILDARGHVTEPRAPLRPLAGILSARSSWPDPFGDAFSNAVMKASPSGALDLGIGVEHGAFELGYPGIEGNPNVSAVQISRSKPESSLIFFLSHLSQRLLRLGSVPALDLEAYTDLLEG